MQVNTEDCMGCGNCADICPAKKKALVMKPLETQIDTRCPTMKYAVEPAVRDELVKRKTVKGSQFCQPLLEFSGACAGCGETPYAKLLTQLFGERMVIGNATGCSSIWGGSAPAIPYCVNKDGSGPPGATPCSRTRPSSPTACCWGLAAAQQPGGAGGAGLQPISMNSKTALQGWLDNMKDAEGSRNYGDQLKALLPANSATIPAG
jgi:pyruvate-ferredoxin/flavodoxin oxidoreductase